MNYKENIKSPDHYCSNGVETIKIIEMACTKLKDTIDPYEGYCIGNIIKYLTRYPKKGKLEDLEKAKVYVDFMIEHYKENNSGTF